MTDFYVFNFVPVLLLEVLVLRLLRWASLPLCFLDALVMNFASFIVLMLGIAPYISSAKVLGLSLFFTYSFLVEAFILCLLERRTIKMACIAAFVANLAGVMYLALDAFFTVR